MLIEIKHNISALTSSSNSSTADIKNKLSTLLDTPPADAFIAVENAVKTAAAATLEAITTTTTTSAHTIELLPQLINELRNDFADSTTTLASNIKSHMDEVAKVFSTTDLHICDPAQPNHQTYMSLAEELDQEQNENTSGSRIETHQQQQHQQQQPEEHLSNNNYVSKDIADLFAERRAKITQQRIKEQDQIPNSSGYRRLGNKTVWKRDWTDFDAKQRIRRLQEKEAFKARRKRKNSKKQNNTNKNCSRTNYRTNNNIDNNRNTNKNYTNCNNSRNNDINSNNYNKNRSGTINNSNIINSNNNKDNKNNPLPLDKDLLAAARVQFAGPPPSIDHPVTGLSIGAAKSKFIDFKKGETINPYRGNTLQQNQSMMKHNTNQHTSGSQVNPDSQFELDPMRPPIVRLTEQSVEGDGRFLKARLRDPKIMKIVRLYLAYMKDKPSTICVDGMTSTSIRMLLASEGLPTDPVHLHRIFAEVHQEYGLNSTEAAADLLSYQQFLSSERTHRLQQLRESTKKFFSHPSESSFRK